MSTTYTSKCKGTGQKGDWSEYNRPSKCKGTGQKGDWSEYNRVSVGFRPERQLV